MTRGVPVRVFEANWMQIEEYLRRDDRIVLPTGSTEQHGYLSLGTDAILAERVAVEAAEPLGIPVLPALPFGMAPYFAAFPGSMSLRITTYVEVLRDLLDGLAAQGFRRSRSSTGTGDRAGRRVPPRVGQPAAPGAGPGTFHSGYNAPLRPVGLVFGLEAATPIENEIDRLDVLYCLGLRQIGIAYSDANALGSGLAETSDGGLTALGRRAVTRMNRLGLAIDVSHSSDNTALDVCRHTDRPV